MDNLSDVKTARDFAIEQGEEYLKTISKLEERIIELERVLAMIPVSKLNGKICLPCIIYWIKEHKHI